MNGSKEFIRYIEALKSLAGDLAAAALACSDDLPTGCQAAQELAKSQNPSLLETAFAQGSMLSIVARDHLQGFIRSLNEPVLTIALWSNSRSALESASIGCWLLDPAISEHERISRSLAFRCEGLRQQISFSRATNDTAALKNTKARLDKIIKAAEAVGFSAVRVKKGKNKGKLTGAGQLMPAITVLIETTLGMGKVYKLMCSMVHADTWALQQLGFLQVVDDSGEPKKVPGKGGDLYLFKKGFPLIAIHFLALKTGKAVCEFHLRKWSLMGHDVEIMRGIKDRFIECLST